MARKNTLTDEVRSYRPAEFWRVLDECDPDAPVDMTGRAFGTLNGARAVFVEAGAFWRWSWLCPQCGRRCGVLYAVTFYGPVCRVCGRLRYPSSYEKRKGGLFGYLREIRHTERRLEQLRARWQRYYWRHRAHIVARKRELRAMKVK
jgi:hypothetical protein